MGSAKFWLDGGYDRHLVEACRLHPDHDWTAIKLGDIFKPRELGPRDPDDVMVVCRVCAVPRCHGSEMDGCDLPRHHTEDHRTPSGQSWPVGGTRPRTEADHE